MADPTDAALDPTAGSSRRARFRASVGQLADRSTSQDLVRWMLVPGSLAVLLGFVALLVISVAQMAALLPDYSERAQELIDGVVNDLNDAGIVSGQFSDLVEQIDYGSVVALATDLLGRITSAASTLGDRRRTQPDQASASPFRTTSAHSAVHTSS